MCVGSLSLWFFPLLSSLGKKISNLNVNVVVRFDVLSKWAATTFSTPSPTDNNKNSKRCFKRNERKSSKRVKVRVRVKEKVFNLVSERIECKMYFFASSCNLPLFSNINFFKSCYIRTLRSKTNEKPALDRIEQFAQTLQVLMFFIAFRVYFHCYSIVSLSLSLSIRIYT